MENFSSVCLRLKSNKISILDQRKIPQEEVWLEVTTAAKMHKIIKRLSVRGAPLIGVCASLMIGVLALEKTNSLEQLKEWSEYLKTSRPTAVNLFTCLDRMLVIMKTNEEKMDETNVKGLLVKEAEAILKEEVEMCERMGEHGAKLIESGDNILTYCNTGGLATPGVGTALGVIIKAHQSGKKIHVYACETRPLLQGGRLTAWELAKNKIPFTLICDNMAASLMRKGKIDKVFLGADRIATNGDFANKIGTYSVAIAAKLHNVPMYSVAPVSTIDFECESGDQIEIEQREPKEVRGVRDYIWAPDCNCYNPAFDVTPIETVSGIVLDVGVFTTKEIQSGALKKLKK
ncbi:methylthioribose-1-phosphate isomerase [Anaeramoeba flamelloides]|uniref:Methylthioribose-1-phosphate isomerase n=1 Tax=Anaeramoeba flamelloides TaxID=1746091 RepID=A0AAV7Y6H7_9EUKA|nr:methylthioribose-1-phosphate isomerase [Anaeramoeba flamelloides]KAJ6248160.1 methylthioribose-1-phosphate isomerase [Anaeramoeba flamelloides]